MSVPRVVIVLFAVSLSFGCAHRPPPAPPPPDDPAAQRMEYRVLVARYAALGDEDYTDTAVALRQRIAARGDTIAARLPPGVHREDVIRELGKPAGDVAGDLYYLGSRRSWFHVFVFKDDVLLKHGELFANDLEGGR